VLGRLYSQKRRQGRDVAAWIPAVDPCRDRLEAGYTDNPHVPGGPSAGTSNSVKHYSWRAEPYHVIYKCNGFPNTSARCGSPLW
jgi:hypothetical protein